MDSTRRARIQSLIQEEAYFYISRELKDPRIRPLTVTRVELTPDAGMATIYITLLGGPSMVENYDTKIKECIQGLLSASGKIRRHLGSILKIRSTPEVNFKEDRGIENANRVFELLKTIEDTPSSEKKSGSTPEST